MVRTRQVWKFCRRLCRFLSPRVLGTAHFRAAPSMRKTVYSEASTESWETLFRPVSTCSGKWRTQSSWCVAETALWAGSWMSWVILIVLIIILILIGQTCKIVDKNKFSDKNITLAKRINLLPNFTPIYPNLTKKNDLKTQKYGKLYDKLKNYTYNVCDVCDILKVSRS